MRTLEVRRHTMRNKPGAHLSQSGIALAKQVGASMSPFAFVATSTLPRAFETAIAFGFEVSETLDALSLLPEEVFVETGWPANFEQVGNSVAAQGASANFARAQADLWQTIVERVPEGKQALIVSHGGIVELGAVALAPHANHKEWGDAIGYCEGVRLLFGENSVGVELLRLHQNQRLIEN